MYLYFIDFDFRWTEGWVENVVDSTRFNRIDTNRFPCCRFVMPEVDLRETQLRANRVES